MFLTAPQKGSPHTYTRLMGSSTVSSFLLHYYASSLKVTYDSNDKSSIVTQEMLNFFQVTVFCYPSWTPGDIFTTTVHVPDLQDSV